MSQQQLDESDRLMEQAVEAVDAGDFELAMVRLKALVGAEPDNAMAIYLLATVHAGMGMHARAVSEMVSVLELEPDFHVARFQLGLILLAHGQGADTMAAWEHFQGLGEDDCFFLFRRGVEYFLLDQLDESVRDLKAGILANEHYESVVEDMVSILEEVQTRQAPELTAGS
jgi:tetratricopeptide (TPR) repeat protein